MERRRSRIADLQGRCPTATLLHTAPDRPALTVALAPEHPHASIRAGGDRSTEDIARFLADGLHARPTRPRSCAHQYTVRTAFVRHPGHRHRAGHSGD